MVKENFFLENTAFGERLRFLREKAGLSQTALAEKLGYKRSNSVSNLEKGKSPPDLKTLQKIASFFNTNLHWLITGKMSPDGESWRSSYSELLRMYHTDTGLYLDQLNREINDYKVKLIPLTNEQGNGGRDKRGEIERYEEEIAARQGKIDKIEKHTKQAFDRIGGNRPERS
jgi:transcriptional regulator with XRE-family HTH domain